MSKISKNILDLEILKKKYDNLLIQYNQAQIDYANYLNNTKNKSPIVEGLTLASKVKAKAASIAKTVSTAKAKSASTAKAKTASAPKAKSAPKATATQKAVATVAAAATAVATALATAVSSAAAKATGTTGETGETGIITNKDFTSIKGYVVYNSNMIIKKAETIEQCIALCSADPTCKSATFNPIDYDQPQCWLNKNEGNVIPSPGSNNYAIVEKEKQLLLTIQALNSQLSDVNSKILKFIKDHKHLHNDIIDEKNIQYNILEQNLNNLKLEKIKFSHKINEFENLEHEQKYSELITNKNYYGYLVILLLFCICVFILSKFVVNKVITDNNQSINGSQILIAVIITVLIVSLILFFTKKKIN